MLDEKLGYSWALKLFEWPENDEDWKKWREIHKKFRVECLWMAHSKYHEHFSDFLEPSEADPDPKPISRKTSEAWESGAIKPKPSKFPAFRRMVMKWLDANIGETTSVKQPPPGKPVPENLQEWAENLEHRVDQLFRVNELVIEGLSRVLAKMDLPPMGI